ncbi:MAG: tetratricopeptide repeat protein [Planctomycetota bacterium]
MSVVRRATFSLTLIAGLLLAAQGCLLAASPTTAAAPETKPEPREPTPTDQVSQDLLQRLARDLAVQRQQERFLADQHVATGKIHFEHRDWQKARDHFAKAVELNPHHAEAAHYLRRARAMLGLRRGEFGSLMRDYVNQRSVALQARKMDLVNAFARAKELYERGRYEQAIEAFTRVRAKAKTLLPLIDASDLVEEAADYERQADEARQRQRRGATDERRRRALEESRRLRRQRQRRMAARNQQRFDQAQTLLDQRRYDQARALCDAILRDDPSHGGATDLRERAVEASRDAVVDRAVRERRREVDLHWRLTESWTSPQNQIVSMPRDLFEKVKNRKVPVVLGGEDVEPEPWERAIREKLRTQKVTFDFVETPLPDVLAFISSLTDTTIILDPDAVQGPAPAITLRVSDMSLERALNWICRLANLKYSLKNEALYVAHPDKLRDRVVLRMYDVTDLTMEVQNFAGRQQALATSEGRGADDGGGGDALKDFWPDEDEDEEERLTGERLIEFIRSMIAPESWEREDHEILEQPFGALFDDDLPKAHAGRELVDILGMTVGGRTYVGIRTRE